MKVNQALLLDQINKKKEKEKKIWADAILLRGVSGAAETDGAGAVATGGHEQ